VSADADAGMAAGLRVLLTAACGVSVANVYYAQPLLDRIGTDLNVRADRLGLVTAVTQLGYLLGLVLIVPLGDLVSRRLLIVAQALVAAAALAVVGLSGGTAVFFAASSVVGLACVVVQVIVAYAATLSAPGQRGTVVGTVTSGVVIGILLARTASGFAADLLGWRAVYLMSAGLMLMLAIALGRLLPRDNSPRARVSYPALISSVLTLTARDRTFRVRSVLGLLMFGCFGAVWGSMALPLSAAPWHLSAGKIGLFGIAGAAGALSAGHAGRLADRGHAQLVSGISLVLLALSWAGTQAAPHCLPLLAIGVVLLDFAGQALHVTSQHLIVGTDPAASSRIIGGYMAYYSIGTGGGAIAATSLYGVAGWGAVSALGAGLSTLALLVWAADRLRQRGQGPPQQPDPGTAGPSASTVSQSRQPAREHP
jgi:predicted MFS family arabinose efflux permease